MPIYFPSTDITGIRPARFYVSPIDWKKITDSYEFEDGGKTFNEVASHAPKRWEYGLTNLKQAQADYFDAFFDSVRFVTPFYFIDKWGSTWINVYIEDYKRSHDAHKSWSHAVTFQLISYSADSLDAVTGLEVIDTTSSSATLDWDS